jgi:cell division septum initiation protein DivIVA
VQWVNSELHTIASTIEDLQSRLEQANVRLETVSKVETTEVQIGRLFVEAQTFCESSLANLEVQVHEILLEADTKAKQMILEANEEAQEIRRQAQRAALASNETVRELQVAIAGFTRVNADLLTELGALNNMLLPGEGGGLANHNPSPDTPHSIGND